MKSTCHSITEVGSVRIVLRDSFLTNFASLGEQIKIFDGAPFQSQNQIKNMAISLCYPLSLNNLAADWLQPYNIDFYIDIYRFLTDLE